MRPPFHSQALLFDLDGTLIDTVPDIAAAVDRALLDLSLPAAGLARVRGWVGNGAAKLLERALRHAGAPPEEMSARALDLFLQHYGDEFTVRSELYEGVAETLDRLAARGLRLAVCTNKPSAFVAPLLRHFRIDHHFALSIGADELPQRKPHPAPLLHIAASFGLKPAECLMVGDSVNDVEAARAAGMPVIAVSYGYNHGAPIADSRPDAVVDRFAQIVELIAV
ncbi:MAG TPA: phosphoglycolate phosphatase [Nevskia sp.]|nr:phosphoglycolate phosphatase [Nevskia sp.]